jgi:hypothetical protein
LQQWQSSAKSPLNLNPVEALLGTNALKLNEGLRKAESSLAIQLRTGINGMDTIFVQAKVHSIFSTLYSCGRGCPTKNHV